MAKQIMNGRAVMDSDERVSAGENKIPESIRQVRPKRELPASAKKRKPAFVVCDHAHFVGLGFWGSGAKPSAIRLSKQVTVDECEALFGSPQGQRQKFRYTACTDREMVAKIEAYWPGLHSKSEMPNNCLLSMEFIMGMIAEDKKIKVNWAAFGVEQNIKQRAGSAKGVIELSHDLEESGGLGLQSVGCASGSKMTGSESVEKSLASEISAERRSGEDSGGLTTAWSQKLASEVLDLLHLASVEWYASRQAVLRQSTENVKLEEKTRGEMHVMDSFVAGVEVQAVQLQELELAAVRKEKEHLNDVLVSHVNLQHGVESCERSTVLQGESAGCGGTDLEVRPVLAANSASAVTPSVADAQKLLSCRQKHEWLSVMAQDHKLAYERYAEDLERKKIAQKEEECKRDLHEAMHVMLGEQHGKLSKGQSGVAIFPHPLPYPVAHFDEEGFALKITHCVKCKAGFRFNDVILSSCRHAYHPWCAALHYKKSYHCAYQPCKGLASPEWTKSFGFREFDKHMMEKEVSEGCEEARVHTIHVRRELALTNCGSVGNSEDLDKFLADLIGENSIISICDLLCCLRESLLYHVRLQCILVCMRRQAFACNVRFTSV